MPACDVRIAPTDCRFNPLRLTPLTILTLQGWQVRGFSLRENAHARGANGHVPRKLSLWIPNGVTLRPRAGGSAFGNYTHRPATWGGNASRSGRYVPPDQKNRRLSDNKHKQTKATIPCEANNMSDRCIRTPWQSDRRTRWRCGSSGLASAETPMGASTRFGACDGVGPSW